jgi:hypothetical protein
MIIILWKNQYTIWIHICIQNVPLLPISSLTWNILPFSTVGSNLDRNLLLSYKEEIELRAYIMHSWVLTWGSSPPVKRKVALGPLIWLFFQKSVLINKWEMPWKSESKENLRKTRKLFCNYLIRQFSFPSKSYLHL